MANTLRKDIESAYMAYNGAVARQSGLSLAKERLKNVLFNNVKGILDVLGESAKKDKQIKELTEERDMLDVSLKEADDEITKLKKSASKAGK